MGMMARALGPGLAVLLALTASACSETAVQDLLGNGKANRPDASQITVSQNLSMPPDLQLRAPPEGPSSDNQAMAVQQPVEPIAAATEPPSQPKPLPPTKTASLEAPKQDAYERYGIPKTYPDGKPKPEKVLIEELRQAQLAEKRKSNPNYGTIWNIGNVFKDE
ncbi:MAG: hypothetical protein ACJ8AS_10890 [Hyphomicrobiales bacterium]